MSANGKRLTIRDWAEDDRPREKMLQKGISSLSDAELLAILIASGNKDESAVELSRRILREANDNINELAKLSINDLCKSFKGIGQAKAITIAAALELGRRRKAEEVLEKPKISSSKDLHRLFEPHLIDLPHEEFWICIVNTALRVLDVRRLTQGGLNQSVVDIPMLLKLSLEKSAHAIAVGHNHPSGQCLPSSEDKFITKKIALACEAVGIRFIDHIIVGGNGYYSFADEGGL